MLSKSVVAVLVVVLLMGVEGPRAVAQRSMLDDVFNDAIDVAQLRTVKVIGATVGRVEGYGSGIVVSPDGLILTAAGVNLTGRSIRVMTPDGTIHQATLLRTDRMHQLALLKIDADTPDHFELSEQPVGEKGDWVVTLSNAFKVADGEEPMSANLGVVSLRTWIEAYRTSRELAYRGPLVLIDAITSNPGAAGGAVVTVDGRLVGMIGKVIESSDTNTRLNYAVPSEVLLAFVENRLSDDTVAANDNGNDVGAANRPATLGIRLFGLGGVRSPAYVDRVLPGSPAAELGIRPDDLVMHLDGERIQSIRDFNEVQRRLVPGQTIVIVIKRDEALLRFEITPVER